MNQVLVAAVPIACLSIGSIAAEPAPASAVNWPQFRGERAHGVSDGFATPVTWDVATGANVAWTTPVRGLAHSSPIVWGDRVFVTSAARVEGESELSSLFGSPGYGAGESVMNEAEHEFTVTCLDLGTGEELWRRIAHRGVPKVKRHPKSSHANPTPACNAEVVVAFFGSDGLYCYDHEGALRWKRDLGVLNSGAPGYPDKDGFQWGFASSPVIHGDRVFVQCDHEGESFVAALDLATGADVWRAARDEDSTWCTPTVHETGAGGHAQLILNGYQHVGGYDLDTGEELWKLVGGGDVPVPTPVVAHGLIFLTSAHGRQRPLRAISVGAAGLLANDPEQEQHLAWLQPRRGVYMQTPLVVGDLLYVCSDPGVLACYDAKTGAERYRERLGTGQTGFSGSPVAADGKIYCSGESGEIFVVKAGPEFEVLATNDMGETCMATPAIAGGTLVFRTRRQVVAIRDQTIDETAASARAAATTAAANWPHWRGPARDGVSRETGWASIGTPEAVWTRSVGLGYSSVSVVNGSLYTMGYDAERGVDVIHCLDAATGAERWTHSYPAKIWKEMHTGGTLTTPSVDGGVVYTLNREGRFFCLDAADGAVVCSADLAARFGLEPPHWGFAASPLVLDDMVVLNVAKVLAFKKRTTELLWQTRFYGDAYATPTVLTVDGRPELGVINSEGLAVLNPVTGRERTVHEWKTRWDVNAPTPIPLTGNRVFISSGYNHGCAMLRIVGDEANVLWESKVMRNKLTGSVLWEDHLYGFDDATLKCIDLEGNEKWRQRGLGQGAFMVSDGRLIIMTGDGELVIARASPDQYTELSRATVLEGGVCWTSPVLAGGMIYCRNSEGKLVCRDHR